MTIYKRPDNTIFAESAQSGEVVAFENMPRGWGVTLDNTKGIPPMEWFNFLQNRTDKAINYILQNGITEYDTNLEYPQNAVVKNGGKLYLCLRQNTNKPLSNGAYWELLIKNATTSQSGVVELSSLVTSTDETKASTPKATKIAYDKAVKADNNANTRVKIDGSTEMTAPLIIHKAQYPNVTLKTEGGRIYLETANGKNCHLACRNTQDNLLWDIDYPQKSGVLLLNTDKSSSTTSASEDTIATSLAVKTAYDKAVEASERNASSEYLIAEDKRDVKPNTTGITDRRGIKAFFANGENFNLSSRHIDLLVLDTYSDVSGGAINAMAFDKEQSKVWHIKGAFNGSNWRKPSMFYTTENPPSQVLTGSIQAFASDRNQKGYLKCDGGLYSTTTYADLFAEIGYTWGGSGNKFAVPNITDKARFLRSSGNGLEVGTYQDDAIRNMKGIISGIPHGEQYSFDVSGVFKNDGNNYNKTGNANNGSGPTEIVSFDASRVVPTADENRPYACVVAYWIKY